MSAFTSDEFPILCETCFGDNPRLRMTREKKGSACKICERPFDVYRWKPGPRARFKKTEICKTCAKLKNVCQTCILDLEYGLPVQVRDEALKHETGSMNSIVLQNMPMQRANRDWMYEQIENNTGIGRMQGGNGALSLPYDKITKDKNDGSTYGNQMLLRLHRTEPYYKRNLPHICSFYVKGTCNRGDSCPYRHELPIKGELSDQNIKDRFFGNNDPVAKKMLEKHNEWKNGGPSGSSGKEAPPAPDDVTIRSLFIGNIDYSITEDHIRDKFEHFGAIGLINVLHNKKCAFVTFNSRIHAEAAMNTLHDSLFLNNKRCKLHWGKNGMNSNSNSGTNSPNKSDNNGKNESKTDDSDGNKNKSNQEKSKTKSKDSEDEDESDEDGLDAPPGMRKAPIYTASERDYLEKQGILPPELPPLPDPSLSMITQTKNGGYQSKEARNNYKSMNKHYNEANFYDYSNDMNGNNSGNQRLGGQYAYPTQALFSNMKQQQKQYQPQFQFSNNMNTSNNNNSNNNSNSSN